VLVGPNGSGKSSIIDVLRFLHDCVDKSLSQAVAARQGFRGLSRWSPGKPHLIDVAAEFHPFGEASGFWGFTLDVSSGKDEFVVRREYAYFRGFLSPEPRLEATFDDFLHSKDGRDLGAELFEVLGDELHS
jgi:hypothetical protein